MLKHEKLNIASNGSNLEYKPGIEDASVVKTNPPVEILERERETGRGRGEQDTVQRRNPKRKIVFNLFIYLFFISFLNFLKRFAFIYFEKKKSV